MNSKTVAQCVEFYYSYKKQVKIGRNGTLIYGEMEPPETQPTEEEVDCKVSKRVCVCVLSVCVITYTHVQMSGVSYSVSPAQQSSHRFELRKEENKDRKWDESVDRKRESSPESVSQSLHASENVSKNLYMPSKD